MTMTMSGVDVALIVEVQQFLYREARLLDEERLEEWLGLMAPDIHYWMPGVQARRRKDKAPAISRERMAFFDDDLDYLQKRVRRARHDNAWAEDPPTRHLHLVSNIEVEATERPDEWLVHSAVINVRCRNETEEYWLSARRRDVVRRIGQELKLARREVRLQETVLSAKNINTFL